MLLARTPHRRRRSYYRNIAKVESCDNVTFSRCIVKIEEVFVRCNGSNSSCALRSNSACQLPPVNWRGAVSSGKL